MASAAQSPGSLTSSPVAVSASAAAAASLAANNNFIVNLKNSLCPGLRGQGDGQLKHGRSSSTLHTQGSRRNVAIAADGPRSERIGSSHSPVAEHVFSRTSERIVTRDYHALAPERERRRMIVSATGFGSPNHEPYKPLGPPVLNVEELISETLKIQIAGSSVGGGPSSSAVHHSSSSRNSRHFNSQLSNQSQASMAAANTGSRRVSSAPTKKTTVSRLHAGVSGARSAPVPRGDKSAGRRGVRETNDGFDILQEKLAESRIRLQIVKYGGTLAQAFDTQRQRDARRNTTFISPISTKQQKSTSGSGQSYLSFSPKNVDFDKMQTILRLPLLVPGAPPARPVMAPKPVLELDGESNEAANSKVSTDEIGNSGARAESPPTEKKDVTQEELNGRAIAVLSQSSRGASGADEAVHGMRESFEKVKLQMNHALQHDLQRVERLRSTLIVEKSKVLRISCNGACSTDMETMRLAARKKLQERRKHLLRVHPWFHELVRIASCNGLRLKITEPETRLIRHVKLLIGDCGDVRRGDFPGLLRLIPVGDFLRDEIQRLVKFLKISLQISELEYLDALEESGHMHASGVAAGNSAQIAAVALKYFHN